MSLPPPPPVTDRWVLHVAATPHRVDDVLADLCIHKRARPAGDPGYPAYLEGRETPSEPPAWMSFARAQLEQRGYRTLWCDPGCPHHPQPGTALSAGTRQAGPAPAGRLGHRHGRSGTSLRWLTGRAPHRHPAPRPRHDQPG